MVDTIWLEARRRLRDELPEKDYETWIEPLRAVRWAAGELTIEAPSGFFRDWLRRRFLSTLERAVVEVHGAPVSVTLVVNRELDVPAHAPPARSSHEPKLGTPPPARHTFDDFVVGTSNQVAYGAAQAVVAQPGARFNPLIVFGGVGLGKTHLLGAVHGGLASERREVMSISAENFVNELIAALRRDQMARFRARFRRIETLVVDDIQFLAGKRRSQEEFFHTFNALHDGRKQIVLASDRAPHQIRGIEEALRNRFAMGLLAEIEPPDPALRVALVRRKAAGFGMVLEPEVIEYLADHSCTNVRELEGVLRRLEAFASLSARTVTLALAREAAGSCASEHESRPTIERVIDEVCHHFELSRGELVSPRRTVRVAVPRQLAMYLCRQHTDVPLSRIGAALGGRDHSTVVHALGAIERRLEKDAALRRAVTALRARLK